MSTSQNSSTPPNLRIVPNSKGFTTDQANSLPASYELKIAEMSGYDYVFAPDTICRKYNNLEALSEFLSNIRTILGIVRSRTILISYWHDHNKELHFEKYDLKWGGDIALDWKKSLLDSTPQVDFIRTLYHHSESHAFNDCF